MVEFSKKQLLEFLKDSGVPKDKCVEGGEVVNLFKLLKIEPVLLGNGLRQPTPYEILGVPPVFVGEKERPIVFAIKNRVKKIGKYEGEDLTFFYKSKKVKNEKSTIESLVSDYKRAVFFGDEAHAQSLLETISNISKDAAQKLQTSFYDYSKFYRRMKKQMIIDLFSHFFLMYLRLTMRSVKSGIVRGNKIYKPFKQPQQKGIEEDEIESQPINFDAIIDPVALEMSGIQKVTVQSGEEDPVLNFDFNSKAQNVSNEKQTKLNQTVTVPTKSITPEKNIEPVEEKFEADKTDEIPNFFEGLKKSCLKKKKRLFAKHFEFNGFSQDEIDESEIDIDENKNEDKQKSQNQKYLDSIETKYEY